MAHFSGLSSLLLCAAFRRWTNYVFMLSQISCVSKFPNISCLENELRLVRTKQQHRAIQQKRVTTKFFCLFFKSARSQVKPSNTKWPLNLCKFSNGRLAKMSHYASMTENMHHMTQMGP